MSIEQQRGLSYVPGDRHYRAFVGPSQDYDLVAYWQFSLLAALGLRDYHKLLDIGCGSLRGGRLFIPYLLPGNYYGIEPERWLVEQGINYELGQDQIRLKSPTFDYNSDFNLGVFGVKFDFLIAQSIFSHASKTQIQSCLREASKVMHSNSIFAATFLPADISYEGEGWVYPDCVNYRPVDLEKMATENGLCARVIKWHHTRQSWILFIKPDNEKTFDLIEKELYFPGATKPYFHEPIRLSESEKQAYLEQISALRSALEQALIEKEHILAQMQPLQNWALEMQQHLLSQKRPPHFLLFAKNVIKKIYR